MNRDDFVEAARPPYVARARLAETLLALHIDPDSSISLRRQLYVELRKTFVRGTLPPGTRLPSSRELARRLELSRATVVEVFAELAAEGIVTGRPGSGTFVASRPSPERSSAGTSQPRRLSLRGERVVTASERMTLAFGRPMGAFRTGVPAIDTFPNEMWTRHLVRVTRRQRIETLDYGEAAGYLPLREAIAERLGVTRGIACTAEHVFVVAGTQQAMDYIAQLLVDPEDPVCVEDPGYVPARSAFLATGARLVPGPVDERGLDVEAAQSREPRPKIIVVTPSHQYPLAVTLSAQRRAALIDWAKHAQAWIVEDDYESEFRYDGHPLDALQAIDDSGRVIYVGTFSKTLFPSLRIGYIVAPSSLKDAFSAFARLGALSPKLVEQAALASLLESGDFARHVDRVRRLYAQRQRALVDAVEARIGSLLMLAPAASGLHLFGRLASHIDDKAVAASAAARNIYVAPSSSLTLDASCNGLVLGYAIASPREIRRGVDVLTECIEHVARDTVKHADRSR